MPCLSVVGSEKKHGIMVVVVYDCITVNTDKCRICLPNIKKWNRRLKLEPSIICYLHTQYRYLYYTVK
jgi:hypothetical protein